MVRALEKYSLGSFIFSDRKGVLKAVQALQTGRRQPKGRHRRLEKRVFFAALPQKCQIRWMKAHLTRAAVEQGVVSAEDLFGDGQADRLANLGTAEHAPLEPATSWTYWADFANKVFRFWRLVGPLLRQRPESEPPEVGIIGMAFPEMPFLIGPHQRVVRHGVSLAMS
eukprot:2597733-Amphidinium_carterae.1